MKLKFENKLLLPGWGLAQPQKYAETVSKMGRRTRFDWTGCLHHLMARGIDGQPVFYSPKDKTDLLERLGDLSVETDTKIYSWAIMPNHLHLLARTAETPISSFMHRLLTGYAVSYNLRNERTGYVFQGRFKSILVQEESYFLKLVKYIHLNPLKAGIVKDFSSLERYRWCGHGSIMGYHSVLWHDRSYVLSRFGFDAANQVDMYFNFIKEESADKDTESLVQGNYILGKKGIIAPSDSNSCNRWNSNCRILGSKKFALGIVRKLKRNGQWPVRERQDIHEGINRVLEYVQQYTGISLNRLRGNARDIAVSDARALVSWVCTYQLGLSKTEIALLLGMSRTGITKAINRGAKLYLDSDFIQEYLVYEVSQVKSGPEGGG